MRARYLEDFKPGDTFTTPRRMLSGDDIADFARRFAPAPAPALAVFHLLALSFRLILDSGVISGTNMGGAAAEAISLERSVGPGEAVAVTASVLEARPSTSKPDRGTARIRYELGNDAGETVLGFTITHVMRRRPHPVMHKPPETL
ncbi:MAG: acyl dehydratase [Pseudomonadota bacterium]